MKVLTIAEFVYKNARNTNINCKFLKLNCRYYFSILFKGKIHLCFIIN